MRIYTYNENCTLKGCIYSGEDAADNGDVALWGEGTEEELIAQALASLALRSDHRAGGAGDSFRWSKARSVLDYLGGPEVEYDEMARAYLPVAADDLADEERESDSE